MPHNEEPLDPAEPSVRHKELEELRELPRTLLGGTLAMRAAKQKYLPAEGGEAGGEYDDRLKRTVLYNGYGRTVKRLTGEVFSEPITVTGASRDLEGWVENIDLAGLNLHRFLRQVFFWGMTDGVSYIFPDHTPRLAPPPENEAGEVIETESDVRREAGRPFWRFYKAGDIPRIVTGVQGGRQRVLRIHVPVTETGDSKRWERERQRTVRVYYAAGEPFHDGRIFDFTACQIWREMENEKGERIWIDDELPILMEPLTEIPLVPFYTDSDHGFFDAEPTLQDLAYLQLSHWQKRSDFDWTLHNTAGVPTVGLYGDFPENILELGRLRSIRSPDPNAKAEWLEVKGEGLKLLREDLIDLEARLLLLGLQPLMSKPSGGLVTATENIITRQEANCELEQWAQSFRDTIKMALGFTAQWVGEAWTGDVNIKTDFDLDLPGTAGELRKWWQENYKLGLVEALDYWIEVAKIPGTTSDDFDAKTVAGRLEEPRPLEGEPEPLEE